MAEIRKRPKPEDQVETYRRLLTTMEFYAAWLVLPWDFDAAALFPFIALAACASAAWT